MALLNHNGLRRAHCQHLKSDELVVRLSKLHSSPHYIELAGTTDHIDPSGRDELTDELKLCYDIAVEHIRQGGNTGKNAIKNAIRRSRGTGIGDPKYKKIRAALELDGLV